MENKEIKYGYGMLCVGDADAILIRHFINGRQYVILIDAGNEGDGKKIANFIKTHYKTKDNRCVIDLAICTHPDKDHKDGFFELLDDNTIEISEFWLTDPVTALIEKDPFCVMANTFRKIWNKSNDDSLNLIELVGEKCDSVRSVLDGCKHNILPIKIIGPTSDYYITLLKQMSDEYGNVVYDTTEKNKFDDGSQIDEIEAKSSIDEEDDPSPFNASSLIVLYEPEDGHKLLFTGDANTESLQDMLDEYPSVRKVDLLKVPHHGSKRNLNTSIINELAPKKSYISAAGTMKHPSRGVVYWLSKYGPVYSTHKCKGCVYYDNYGESEKWKDSVVVKPLCEKMKKG